MRLTALGRHHSTSAATGVALAPDAKPLRRLLTLRRSAPPPSVRRPDGLKKAYVRLTTDYDALDVANKIGII
jgi:hypothetical protein